MRLCLMVNNQDFYNRITIFDTFLQLLTMAMVAEDATNNDLMEELQKQDREYLEKIMENQNKILSILSDIKEKGMSADN